MVPDVLSFAYGLFSLLTTNASEPNVLVSPFSIASALGLVLAGTTIDSKCGNELSDTLNVNSHLDLPLLSSAVLESASSEPSVTLTSANGIWSRNLKSSYISTVKAKHAAEASDLPKTYGPIDQYITEKTNGLITNMLEGDIDPLVVAVLVNAVHFKGDWAEKFDSSHTTKGKFTTVSGEERDAMFMFAERKIPVATEVEELQGANMLRLDYGEQNDYAAYFILPDENTKESMNGVIQGLLELSKKGSEALGDVFGKMSSHRKVAVTLPRFKVEYGVRSIKDELRSLGINEAFGGREGFMEMSDDPDVHLDDVLHKAVMEVTEEGTEAAAATVGIMMTRSMPIPPIPMVFDRPFVMAVMHEPTKTPLFLARIDDPVFSF